MVNDVLAAGIYNLDIRGEILSINWVLQTSANDIIALIESKKMARKAMPSMASAISMLKKNQCAAKR